MFNDDVILGSDGEFYRASNRTKILLYKYYILVVFILILAFKILYTY